MGSLDMPDGSDFFQGVAVDSKGNVYAIDGLNILQFNSSGTYLTTIPVKDAGLGPADTLAIDSNDNLYVGNAGTVTKFSTPGKLLEQFECSNVAGADRSIGVDGSGNIYTASIVSTYVIRYSPTGTVTAEGRIGSYITVDSAGDVLAADGTSIRVYHASG